MSISAVVFDLDGTLINSEPVYQTSDREFLAGYNIELGAKESAEYIGLDSREIVRRLIERHGLEEDLQSVLDRKNQAFLAAAREKVRRFPKSFELATHLRERGYPLAIATNTPRYILEEMVALCNLGELFPVTVSTDDVAEGKPSPDIFLEAARLLHTPPDQCAVIEDSRYGVEGARRAGMKVIAVPEDPESAVFATADLVVPGGPEHLTIDEIVRWIERN